jgi:hypothetical protein
VYTGTGNGSGTPGTVATITNGIDLSTNGGLVWIKNRGRVTDHGLYDTARGALNGLQSNGTGAQSAYTNTLTAFTTSGFSLGNDGSNTVNLSGDTYCSWTFREQPKFFDIVTYTGTGSVMTVPHSLGSVPGCIIVKEISVGGNNWPVYHRSLTATNRIFLNTTSNANNNSGYWNDTEPTSTVFTVGTIAPVNTASNSYVAYLFAHNAGGFGLTGSDNVISCGSFTTDGSGNATVSLGYEPQWIMIKRTNDADNWQMFDVMRGMSQTNIRYLFANTSGAENGFTGNYVFPTATGVSFQNGYLATSSNFIYIAIRRGPMKVPTVGTSVFIPFQGNGNGGVGETVTTNFPVDLSVDEAFPPSTNYGASWMDRLRGSSSSYAPALNSSATYTGAELSQAPTYYTGLDSNTTLFNKDYASLGKFVNWAFRRAPGFFDIVCYTGNGASNNAKTHNLTVAPEILIIKNRAADASGAWYTFHTFTPSNFKRQILSTTDAQTNTTYGSFLDAQPTSTTFTVNSGAGCNASGITYVAYLFATVAGVSKVGTYTGTGVVQTINCGFSGGARFVLVKRTDSTGDWYVYDTARGMVTGNDNYLTWNTRDAQGTINSVTTASTGFQLTAENYVDINTNGGSYIFLAIA